jgi:hypothetical protein
MGQEGLTMSPQQASVSAAVISRERPLLYSLPGHFHLVVPGVQPTPSVAEAGTQSNGRRNKYYLPLQPLATAYCATRVNPVVTLACSGHEVKLCFEARPNAATELESTRS